MLFNSLTEDHLSASYHASPSRITGELFGLLSCSWCCIKWDSKALTIAKPCDASELIFKVPIQLANISLGITRCLSQIKCIEILLLEQPDFLPFMLRCIGTDLMKDGLICEIQSPSLPQELVDDWSTNLIIKKRIKFITCASQRFHWFILNLFDLYSFIRFKMNSLYFLTRACAEPPWCAFVKYSIIKFLTIVIQLVHLSLALYGLLEWVKLGDRLGFVWQKRQIMRFRLPARRAYVLAVWSSVQ